MSITVVRAGLTAKQSANVNQTDCPPGQDTLTNIVPCPALIPKVTKMMFHVSAELTPNTGCVRIVPFVNEVQGDGTILGNIAFWHIEGAAITAQIDERFVWAANWLYDPRAAGGSHVADVNLGNGSGKYLGLGFTPVSGDCHAFSTSLQVIAGVIPSITIDETSANLLADSAGL